MDARIESFRHDADKVLQFLHAEFGKLQTGRANASLVEHVEVDAYGQRMQLKAVAGISVQDARTIIIQPWDKSLLPVMEKAIQSSPLGLNPIVGKDVIRLTLPSLTEERRQDLAKLLGEKLESARIQARRLRDETMKAIDTREKAGEISEDERFRSRQEVEKAVGEFNRKIEELGQAKENEIMTG